MGNHKLNNILLFFSVLWLGVYSFNASAQEILKFQLNEDQDQYIKISGSAQLWLRYTDMNPGSLVKGEERKDLVELSVRRFRLNFEGNLSEKIKVNVLLGNNNINYYTYEDFEIKVLEAYVDYQVNRHLGVGIGKQGWTGLSRFAAPSFTESLAHDIGFTPIPLVVAYDDILRRWGVYARGIIQDFDYRVSLSRPFAPSGKGRDPVEGQATFSTEQPNYQFSTYVKYQVFEHEPQLSAWAPGTFLGKRKILNLGAGFLHQPNTTWQLDGEEILYNDFTSFALDLFYEQPLPNHQAITFYTSYHHHALGKNFIRSFGINNPASAGVPTAYINGPGSSTPIVGTGDFFFVQAGYLLPTDRQNKRQLQFFASSSYGLLEMLDAPALNYNLGFNIFLFNQSSKISLAYENRPLFKNIGNRKDVVERKGMYILQYQVKF